MVEKFNLTWSTYQTMITRSFSSLRNDKVLSDVTLITDDDEPIQAHRVVLSTCSDFFKKVFQRNIHPNLVLYLSDMKSQEINQILDYIYFGEIHIMQDNLDRFVQIAQKLRLEGLRYASGLNEEGDIENILPSKAENEVLSELLTNLDSESSGSPTLPSESKDALMKNYKNYRPPAFESDVDVEKLDKKIKELTEVQGRKSTCKVCGKELFGKYRNQHMADHIETHIEGLSFKCQQCGKLYRTRNLLRSHKYKYCNSKQELH